MMQLKTSILCQREKAWFSAPKCCTERANGRRKRAAGLGSVRKHFFKNALNRQSDNYNGK